ncbi:BNR-4 repeat-containing protein [Pararhizobium gei]|uniref:BNR-4 repeat-containing protein n=1 Tax=Pararhizobium gei TaxID=1395951 RepID=UPI0023DB62ED|nr:BNR-4 repeat-containing protein [Rhizobium gei]
MTTVRNGALLALLLTGNTAMALSPDASAQVCTKPQTGEAGQVQIGETWSGVGTGIGAATTKDGALLTAYFGPDRYIRLASFNPKDGTLCEKSLDSRFDGWDAHNSLTLAISDDGTAHISGNMHADPMVYAQGPASDLDRIKLIPMTGQDEESVTYPHFLKDRAGNLLFLYRSGTSGDGSWQVNRWTDGKWHRLPAVFTDRDGRKAVSAYPTEFVKDKNGLYHVAVVWRHTMDVSSNFAVTYAATWDFKTWQVGRRTAEGPLTPRAMEKVDLPGEGQGLVNNAKLAISDTGVPVILFTRFNADGKNAVFASGRIDGRWQTIQVAASDKRTEIKGGGSIPNLPYGAFLSSSSEDGMQIRAIFSPGEQVNTWLDADTMSLSSNRAPARRTARSPGDVIAIPAGLAEASNRTANVRENGVDGPSRGRLRWFAQKVNFDRPRACTVEAPKACNPPPSPLIWMPGD